MSSANPKRRKSRRRRTSSVDREASRLQIEQKRLSFWNRFSKIESFSKMELMIGGLVVLFLLMVWRILSLLRERRSLVASMRNEYMGDDHKMNKEELQRMLASMISSRMGGNSSTPSSQSEQIAAFFLQQYDSDGDALLDDTEVEKMVDLLDELPSAASDLHIAGGDGVELEMIATLIVFGIAVCIIMTLLQEGKILEHVMRKRLKIGEGRYSELNAAMGFSVQNGNIFGTIGGSEDPTLSSDNNVGGSNGADIYKCLKALKDGRRGAFVVERLATSEKKAMKKYEINQKDQSWELMNELRTNMLTFSHGHPNIVQYERVIETAEHIFVIMELVGREPGQTGVDLFEYLTEHYRGRDFSEATARVMFRQIMGAVKHVHDHDVVHGDIKPENVMVIMFDDPKKQVQLKLIDFGCATFLRHTPLKDRLRVINDVYSAPEVLNSRKEGRIVLGRYTDLYRCGALLYTILMKRAPSTGVPKDSFREGAFFKGDRWLPGSRKALSDSVKDLLTKLLSAKPHERPSCEEILAHEWMSVEDDESEDESEDEEDEEKENTAILKEKTKLRDNGGVSRKNFLSMVPRLQVPIAPPTTRSRTRSSESSSISISSPRSQAGEQFGMIPPPPSSTASARKSTRIRSSAKSNSSRVLTKRSTSQTPN